MTDLLNQHAGAALTLSPNARAGSSVPGEMSATLAGLPADRVSALGTLSARLSRVHNSPRATACRPGGAFSVGTSSGSGSGAGAGGQSLPDSEMVDASGPGPAVLSAETRDALAFANAAIKRYVRIGNTSFLFAHRSPFRNYRR